MFVPAEIVELFRLFLRFCYHKTKMQINAESSSAASSLFVLLIIYGCHGKLFSLFFFALNLAVFYRFCRILFERILFQ